MITFIAATKNLLRHLPIEAVTEFLEGCDVTGLNFVQ